MQLRVRVMKDMACIRTGRANMKNKCGTPAQDRKDHHRGGLAALIYAEYFDGFFDSAQLCRPQRRTNEVVGRAVAADIVAELAGAENPVLLGKIHAQIGKSLFLYSLDPECHVDVIPMHITRFRIDNVRFSAMQRDPDMNGRVGRALVSLHENADDFTSGFECVQ